MPIMVKYNNMKNIKELESDLTLAVAIRNKEWITQSEAKLEHTKDVLGLIDEMDWEDEDGGEFIDTKELKARING